MAHTLICPCLPVLPCAYRHGPCRHAVLHLCGRCGPGCQAVDQSRVQGWADANSGSPGGVELPGSCCMDGSHGTLLRSCCACAMSRECASARLFLRLTGLCLVLPLSPLLTAAASSLSAGADGEGGGSGPGCQPSGGFRGAVRCVGAHVCVWHGQVIYVRIAGKGVGFWLSPSVIACVTFAGYFQHLLVVDPPGLVL
jgi:hypothetical protein